MSKYFDDSEHMAVSPGNRPRRRPNRRVLPPIGREKELAYRLSENPDRDTTTAEGRARASNGMVHDSGFDLDRAIASNHTAYVLLVTASVLMLAIVSAVYAISARGGFKCVSIGHSMTLAGAPQKDCRPAYQSSHRQIPGS